MSHASELALLSTFGHSGHGPGACVAGSPHAAVNRSPRERIQPPTAHPTSKLIQSVDRGSRAARAHRACRGIGRSPAKPNMACKDMLPRAFFGVESDSDGTEGISMFNLAAIILAAGQGTRMKSSIPKVLHSLAGRPLIYYPVRAAIEAGATDVVVVVGHEGEQVQAYLGEMFGKAVRIASQAEQKGTGHAALMAMPEMGTEDHAFVLYGDAPLVEVSDLRTLAAALEGHPEAPLALLTCVLEDPTGYGRVLRDAKGRVSAIREHRDLRNEKERAIDEVNPGFYAARVSFLREALADLKPKNAQNELYLTDIIEAAEKKGGAIAIPTRAASLVGVNDRVQLATAEGAMHRRIIERLGRAGVTY